MSKIADLFATFRARYGNPVMKDGQEIHAVMQSWETAVGAYSERDLRAACASWMTSSKWARWPEPAELIDILKSFGARQEVDRKQIAPRTLAAANDASRWYEGVLSRPLPEGAWPLRWDDAVIHMIADPAHKGKSFAWLLTHAWLEGTIPADFDRTAAAYFEERRVAKEAYLADVKERGALRVHEGRF
ncbi:MAG: hypothetical protein R3D70_06000 [Rhizobiaceae bacterium]